MVTPTRPRTYRYTDAIGGARQLLQVRYEAGELVALLPAFGDGEGAEMLLADMSGDFAPLG